MITGLGGAFVFSHRPEELATWYAQHLGLQFEGSAEFGAFYHTFWVRADTDTSRRLDVSFSIIRAPQSFARPVPEEEPVSMYGDQPFMVNLRTDDLAALITHLKVQGITILKQEQESYGAFAWIRDLDGNRVELYESVVSSSEDD